MIKKLVDYNFPMDLKHMSLDQLELLSVQIREFLLEKLSVTGGHLASNLGIVELTIAIHRYFDTPGDKIVWDVGHQSYVHKILTGRAGAFDGLRQLGGMSGFPKVSESPYDVFDVGHSSTSISIAAGIAKGMKLKGEDKKTIAIIGDGSLTGGLAYEGLNNLGDSDDKVIIILNDNNMSIDENTGGLSNHLSKLRVSKGYYDFKKKVSKGINRIPVVGKNLSGGLSKMRDSIKYAVVDGVMFEELGFTYMGPIDGHNLESVLEHLEMADAADKSVVIHLITKKGKGYHNAENNPDKFHGIGPFDVTTGISKAAKSVKATYSQVFADKMISLSQRDESIICISAAMVSGTGLDKYKEVFPDRLVDVGIAESHGVTFAAGLAVAGLKPVVAIYSTFLQRAYDQIVEDVCLQELPVIFAIDRGGIVGSDGETHHGVFDLSYLSHIPNLNVMAPINSRELEMMLEYALDLGKPCAIRYPRGNDNFEQSEVMPIDGKSQVMNLGKDVEVWVCGTMMSKVMEAKAILEDMGYQVGVVNGRFVSPLDREELMNAAHRVDHIVTVEDNLIEGGFGQKVASCLSAKDVSVHTIGWENQFIEHGHVDGLYAKYGLDGRGIAERIRRVIEG